MSKDLLGLGDNDIENTDRRTRGELQKLNPDNQLEVTLSQWTIAQLTF